MQRGQPDVKQDDLALESEIQSLLNCVQSWKENDTSINPTTRSIIDTALTKICREIQERVRPSQKIVFKLLKTLFILETINYSVKFFLTDGVLEKIVSCIDIECKPIYFAPANMLWHFAQMKLTWNGDLLKFQSKIVARLEYFADNYLALDISKILWACNKLQLSWQDLPATLRKKLLSSVEHNANQFDAHGLSNVLWFCAKLGVIWNDFAETLQRAMLLSIKSNSSYFTKKDVASFLCACAMMGIPPYKFDPDTRFLLEIKIQKFKNNFDPKEIYRILQAEIWFSCLFWNIMTNDLSVFFQKKIKSSLGFLDSSVIDSLTENLISTFAGEKFEKSEHCGTGCVDFLFRDKKIAIQGYKGYHYDGLNRLNSFGVFYDKLLAINGYKNYRIKRQNKTEIINILNAAGLLKDNFACFWPLGNSIWSMQNQSETAATDQKFDDHTVATLPGSLKF
jgi:hypothetical protein